MVPGKHTATKSDTYKYVYKIIFASGTVKWKAFHQLRNKNNRINKCAYFETEREAAISVDKFLIEKGRAPVNILIKK